MNKVRFHWTCGHDTDQTSETAFRKYSTPYVCKTILGDQTVHNEITEEDGVKVAHVHPMRYFDCPDCIRFSVGEDIPPALQMILLDFCNGADGAE